MNEEFRAYMKAINRTSDNNDNLHLSEAQMIVYCRGEMPEADREAAEAHLIGCEQCIALFSNARDFLEPARQDEEEISTIETNQAWKSLVDRLQIEAPKGANAEGGKVVRGSFQDQRQRRFLSSGVGLAMAASLLIAFGLLTWQTWRLWRERQQSQQKAMQLENSRRELEQQLAQLQQTSTDQLKRERDERFAAEAERDQLLAQLETAQAAQYVPVFSFTLSSERGAEDDLRLRFARAVKAARLRLIINKPYQFPRYAIELADNGGKIVQTISGLRPAGDEGALSFKVQRSTLRAGKYRMRVFGQQEKTRQPLGEYTLSVTLDH